MKDFLGGYYGYMSLQAERACSYTQAGYVGVHTLRSGRTKPSSLMLVVATLILGFLAMDCGDEERSTPTADVAIVAPESTSVSSPPPEGQAKPTPFDLSPDVMAILGPVATPALPVMRIRYGGQVHEGRLGSYCWPVPEPPNRVATLCGDTAFQPPAESVRVKSAESVAIQTEAHERPLALSATIFEASGETPLQSIELAQDLDASFEASLEAGSYIVLLNGQWAEGDVSYIFKIEIE